MWNSLVPSGESKRRDVFLGAERLGEGLPTLGIDDLTQTEEAEEEAKAG